MFATKPIRFLIGAFVFASLSLAPSGASGQQNQVLGELQFSGATNVERNSGVWIDGQYVGYLKELKGDNKIMLLPGVHEVSARQAGYKDFTKKIVVEPGRVQSFPIKMERDPNAQYPAANAALLKLNITPERAAVFMDDGYVGHASDFGGAFHSMLVIPGKHRIKIELPGYQTFETEINLLARQKSEVKTELVRGSIEQAGVLVKEP
jgi:PEGA domain